MGSLEEKAKTKDAVKIDIQKNEFILIDVYDGDVKICRKAMYINKIAATFTQKGKLHVNITDVSFGEEIKINNQYVRHGE